MILAVAALFASAETLAILGFWLYLSIFAAIVLALLLAPNRWEEAASNLQRGVRQRFDPQMAECGRYTRNKRMTTARYFTPSGHSIQAKGIEPDIQVLQEAPADPKVRSDPEGEASLRGHLKAEGKEESGSQSYVPADEKEDRALRKALDLLRGTVADAAFPH
jgi:hypothetical protein